MKPKLISGLSIALFAFTLVTAPGMARAQQSGTQADDAVFQAGSLLFSVLLLPVKLITCVGTQATAAVAYTATYGVEGNYDGGTNGKQIGEVARRSCTGAWVITPEQIKKDYQ